MIFGKLIGAVLGYYSAGVIGLLIGAAVGHFFDRSVSHAMSFNFAADRERLQQLFFDTAFTIMGHIAKADGRVSEEEIAQTEALMSRYGLSAEHRQMAINLFKTGAMPEFKLEPVLEQFVREGGKRQNLPILLLEFLFSVALADGQLHAAEQQILSRTAQYLGINTRQFQRLLSMLTAQQHFHGQYQQFDQQRKPAESELDNAYKALGVKSTDSDRDIKRAYRKLMSQHHPDKLVAQGIPEDMMSIATEKAQEIQTAYDLIKQARK